MSGPCYCPSNTPCTCWSQHRTSSTAFVKHDDDKPQFDLIPAEVELEVAKVLTHGAKKYSPHNFRKGTRWGRYVAATRRHLNTWCLGEDLDPESGRHHLAHAIASLMMLFVLVLTGKGEDDRQVERKP